ncbi:hypothetical protein DNC80_15775, partial [Flavobacterium sp. SOK18b]|uniref:AAA family ATPase n=1 Tax=Flavobacterium sp. SOK18b TaxID=797900 RepID=UPI0015FC16F1
LRLFNHPQLGEIELFLSDIEEINNISKPYTSVIIGPNGTGKSFILRTISDILTQFNIFQTSGIRSINLPFSFHIRYKLENDTFEIISHLEILTKSKEKKTFLFYKNRPFTVKHITIKNTNLFKLHEIKFKEILFPSYVIVNSVMLNDRFLFKNSLPNDFYQYLGVRSTSSTASTKSAIKSVVDIIFKESITNTAFLRNLKHLLHFLDFEESLEVDYQTKINKLFFSGTLTVENFKKYYETWWEKDFEYSQRNKNNPIWSKPYYDKHLKNNETKIIEIVNFLNDLVNSYRLSHKERSRSKILNVNFFNKETTALDLEKISLLEKLDIINIIGIKLSKNKSSLSINDISSGEYHLLISLIGIFSKIKENSLVLIDEPEISLHPNWQMKYITFLKKVFSNYPSCHFILTSHSHFLLSDLEGESSSVTALRRNEDNKLESTLIKADTYGWSAEEILLKVFKTNTSRNYYIAEKLGEFLDFISDKDSTEESIKLKFYELEIDKLSNLSDEDPLKVVYNTIVTEYVFN